MMTSDDIPAWASAIALVVHTLASAVVQVIRAWKQPVTIARSSNTPAAQAPKSSDRGDSSNAK